MSDDGWTYEVDQNGNRWRYRVKPERIQTVGVTYERAVVLVEDADKRGMTLVEYAGWVGRMSSSELHVYRDRVRAGIGGPELEALYDAWLDARVVVRETQMQIMGSWKTV
ncbi:hypothetical protein [Streptomyces sp. NPDC126499]|uniref:hypothetical protein n=1 Tax=Streptomyces sp. NPDC126499 TaxID=3155314 RepID=UPI003333C98C